MKIHFLISVAPCLEGKTPKGMCTLSKQGIVKIVDFNAIDDFNA